MKKNLDLIYEYQDEVMFLYRESGAYDHEAIRTVLVPGNEVCRII